jgi:drug/metabolite transporter (DMT)-like permease
MKHKSDYFKGVVFALINSLALGTVGIIDKIGAGHFTSSIIFSTQSVLFSLMFVICFALFFYKKSFVSKLKKVSFSSWKNIFFVGVFASGLYMIFRFLGLIESTGTFATLIQIVIAAETAILARTFLQEKLSSSFWLLFIVTLIAIYFVSLGEFTLTIPQKGDMYLLIGATFVAIANIFSKLAVNKISPVILAEGRFFFGATFLLLICIFIFHEANSLFSFSIWALLSGLLWAINVLSFNAAIQRIGVTFTASLLMIAPVYTMILEYLILKQTFNSIQIVAAIVVIASGMLMVRLKNK